MKTPNISEIHVNERLLDAFESMIGEDLEIATVAVAISLLHEEVHRGDRITNGGKITGQFVYMQAGIGFVVGNQGDLLEAKQDVKISEFGHRGKELEVNVFGAPNDPTMRKYNNDSSKLMNEGGYTLTLDKWDNTSIKESEKGAVLRVVGADKVKETSKSLQK